MQATNYGLWHMPSVIRHRAQSQRELCHLPWTVLLLAEFPGTPLLGTTLARAQAPLALRQGPHVMQCLLCLAVCLSAKPELLLPAFDTANFMLMLPALDTAKTHAATGLLVLQHSCCCCCCCYCSMLPCSGEASFITNHAVLSVVSR